jgi:serine/threonine protein kinase
VLFELPPQLQDGANSILPIVKLIDFGLANIEDQDESGTPWYMAPEAI